MSLKLWRASNWFFSSIVASNFDVFVVKRGKLLRTEHSFARGGKTRFFELLICKWCHLQVVSFPSGGGSQKIDLALEFKLSKTLSGLVYFVPYLYGGRSPPPITAIQNTQAYSEFLTT